MSAIALPTSDRPSSHWIGLVATGALIMLMAMMMTRGVRVQTVDAGDTPSELCEDIHNAATASRTDVIAARDLSDTGDCVVVPPDPSESWAGDITISGICLIGPGEDAGSPTVITAGIVVLDKHATAETCLIGFRFTGANQHFSITGSDTEALAVVHNNYFFSNASVHSRIETNGCLVSENTFHNDDLGGGNWGHQTLNAGSAANAAWAASPIFGDDDTNGDKNCYYEDNLVENFRDGFIDCDEGARCVHRHNTFRDASLITHGGGSGGGGGNDSSSVGARSLEIYDNGFDRVSNSMALNEWIKFRGASGVVMDNTMENADSPDGSSFPNKPEVNLLVGGCDQGSHPRPYQVGQSTVTPDATPDHPIIISGNSGTTIVIGIGENNVGGCAGGLPATYIQSGRDYVTSNTWGYAKYTYPHPMHPSIDGSGDL